MENSGRPQSEATGTPSSAKAEIRQPGLLALLERWIEEYGDREDPDFDEQLRELESNPVRFAKR